MLIKSFTISHNNIHTLKFFESLKFFTIIKTNNISITNITSIASLEFGSFEQSKTNESVSYDKALLH